VDHFDGKAVVGVLAGDDLEPVFAPLMAWREFAELYPQGAVLDWTATGFERDYGSNPYVGYDDTDAEPFLFRGPVDDRARAKQRVVGVSVDGGAVAYSLDALVGGQASATPVQVGGEDLVIFWKSGQSSALDTFSIGDGKDVGSVGVFAPVVGERRLTFSTEGPDFVDEETGTVWSIAGTAVSGPLEGSRLQRVEHLDTFWFAWATYRPETTFVER